MKELRLVCAGGWHTHYMDFPMDRAQKRAPHIKKKFVAVWDNSEERGKSWAEKLNCDYFSDYDKLLEIPDIDGVIITCETRLHEELITKAAKKHINVFVEKALTITNESAYRICNAVKRSGIKFTVSDPVRHGDLLYAKKMVDDGMIGEVISVRSRMANACAINDQDGIKMYYEKNDSGGGAMIDMGYHNVHRIQLFLGKPIRCAAILNPFTDYGKQKNIDENCVAVYEFEGGKIGIAECSWMTDDCTSLEIYGTNGIIRSDDAGLRYRISGSKWVDVPEEEIPNEDTYPLCYWMESIIHNSECEKYDIDTAVIYTEMVSAAYKGNGSSVKFTTDEKC